MSAPPPASGPALAAPVLLGEGPLAEQVRAAVTMTGQLPQLVVVQRLDQLAVVDWVGCLDALTGSERTPRVLFVGWWRGRIYVGPCWAVGSSGCPACLVTRTANSPGGPEQDGDVVATGSPPRDGATTTLGPAALRVAALLAAEVVTGPAGRLLVLDAGTGGVQEQRLLPDSICAVCGSRRARSSLPLLTAGSAPLTKLAPDVLRCRPVGHLALRRALAGAESGLFKEIWHDLQSPFGACSVELPSRWGPREPAIGRAETYQAARSIALIEGLERYAGLHRGGRPETMRAGYAQIAEKAVHPTSFGTHPEECYARPGARYQRFSPDVEVDWVWAHSMQRSAPVLVPERAAFWGPRRDNEVAFFYDTSNGCAVGSSVEEAVLHGLRELVERDSFLLTWYRRLALPEIDLSDVPDRRLRALLRRCRLGTGFTYRAFLSTMEHGMPSVVLLAVGPGDADVPAVVAGSGAHPDPVQAISGGLYELAGVVLSLRHSYPQRRAAAAAMLADPWQVTAMADHVTVNSVPEAIDRFGFLLERDTTPVSLGDVAATLRSDSIDLRADLETALQGFTDTGLEVLVVDQTMPELAAVGLVCVKVLVPGLLPMTFGHQNRRTEHLPRLSGPLPWPDQRDPALPIGALPHPFP